MKKMELEGILDETKRFLKDKTIDYQGKAQSATANFIKGGIGYIAYDSFDSTTLKLAFGAYAIVKALQFGKDVRDYFGGKK